MFDPSQPDAIFIHIPSYRDPELPMTIQSAIDSADHPEKLSFGIVHQFGPETMHLLDKFRGRPGFRLVEYPWQESRGLGVARSMCRDLYRGEQWSLQIDAHTHFEPGWDTDLINQWNLCDDKMAILSTYPPSFEVDDNYKITRLTDTKNRYAKMYIKKFFYNHIPIYHSRWVDCGSNVKPAKSMLVCGGLVFQRGEVLQKVPFYSEVIFIGEEIIRSVQLYTYGYNVYAPNNMRIYHHYGNRVHNIWDDMKKTGNDNLLKLYQDMDKISYKVSDDILLGKAWNRLGFVRSIDDFQLAAGADFRLKRISLRQKDELEPPFETDSGWVLTDRAVEKLD